MSPGGTTGRRRGAPPAGQRLTREVVVVRAEQVIDRDGYAAFTLRSLARELDVRPSALYNHLHDLDDLLTEISERFLAGFEPTSSKDRPWADWVRSFALDLRRHLLDRPERTELMLPRIPGTATSRKFLKDFLDTLDTAGVDRAIAHQAWHQILALVIGMVQLERHRPPDPGHTFEVILEVTLGSIVAAAGRPPGPQVLALFKAHSLHEIPPADDYEEPDQP